MTVHYYFLLHLGGCQLETHTNTLRENLSSCYCTRNLSSYSNYKMFFKKISLTKSYSQIDSSREVVA